MSFELPSNFAPVERRIVAYGAIIVDPDRHVLTGLETQTEKPWHRKGQLAYPVETWLTETGSDFIRRPVEQWAEAVLRRAIGYDRRVIQRSTFGREVIKEHTVGEEVDGIPFFNHRYSKYLVSIVYVSPTTPGSEIRTWMENYLLLAKSMAVPGDPTKNELTATDWRSFEDLLIPFKDSFATGIPYRASDFRGLPSALAEHLTYYLNWTQHQRSSLSRERIYVGDVMRRPGIFQGLTHTKALMDRFAKEPNFKKTFLRNPRKSGYQPIIEPLMFSPPADFFGF